VQFAQTPPNHHRVAHAQRGGRAGSGGGQGEELHLLQAHDRLLLITEAVGAREGAGPSPNMLGGCATRAARRRAPQPASLAGGRPACPPACLLGWLRIRPPPPAHPAAEAASSG
jgi:hypothetical protein